MKLIAHRGNIDGKISDSENHPIYIDRSLNFGFDVEIDLWYFDHKLFLGHDKPENFISLNWLLERSDSLWIHCKSIPTMYFLQDKSKIFNFFFHDSDDVTITSHGFFWTYPGKELTPNSIACLPEREKFQNLEISLGICSDYISNYKYLNNIS